MKKCIVFSLCIIFLLLTACKSEIARLPESETYFSDGRQVATTEYTYTDGVLTERNMSIFSSEYTKSERFTYNEGKLTELSVSEDGGELSTYSAEEIADRKYELKDRSDKLYAVFTFDNKGRIIGENYATGYVYEQVYKFNKKGLAEVTKLNRMPSGSSKKTVLNSEKTGDNTYRMTDSTDDSMYAIFTFKE